MASSTRLAEGAPPEAGGAAAHHGSLPVLALGALGVVFGDIGTSPLYAMHAIFHADHGAVEPVRSQIYGVVSLVVCLEDSIADEEVPFAEQNTVAQLREYAQTGSSGPLIFVRVRSAYQIRLIVDGLGLP